MLGDGGSESRYARSMYIDGYYGARCKLGDMECLPPDTASEIYY